MEAPWCLRKNSSSSPKEAAYVRIVVDGIRWPDQDQVQVLDDWDFCLQWLDPGNHDPYSAAISRGVAEDGDDRDAYSAASTSTTTTASASAADREADQDGLGDRSGPACADEDSQRHQDGEGRGCATDDGWGRWHERDGEWRRRS